MAGIMSRGQHETSSGWSLLCVLSLVVAALVFFQLDVTVVVRSVCLALLGLGLLTFVLYLTGGQLEAWRKWLFHPQGHGVGEQPGLSAEELAQQQRAVRERIQNEYREKASRYEAQVLRPRQEAKKAQLEKEFYKFAGPAWKGRAQRLADNKVSKENASSEAEQSLPRKRVQGSSRDAAASRRLPESATRPPPVVSEQPKQERNVVVLPDEPDVTDIECVTVAVRGLQGTVKKRRFLYTEKVQVLLDWMTKLGYHPKLYTVCTTFPRRDLSQHADQTLEDIQVVRDVLLAIEERD